MKVDYRSTKSYQLLPNDAKQEYNSRNLSNRKDPEDDAEGYECPFDANGDPVDVVDFINLNK